MKDYQFSIPKARLIVMALCLVSMQIMFYAAGVATGFLIHPAIRPAEKPIPAKASVAPPQARPAAATVETAKIKTENSPMSVAQISGANVAETVAPPAAPSAPAAGDDDDTPALAIQVASFQDEDRAADLADLLRRNNFGPVTVGHMDRADQTWHYVRLGPYRDWDSAARVSAQIDRYYNLHSYIRLIRTN